MLAKNLNWNTVISANKRLMRRLKKGRYEGICKSGKRVRIDEIDGKWELYFGTEFLGKYPLKRTALKKANALLISEECDKEKYE